MAKTTAAAPPETVALYEKLVATNPDIKRKGAMLPYTSLNGHMFSMLTKSGKMALRLPPDTLEEFLTKYKTTRCEQYGTVMKEYVEVPDKLLANTKELKKYFDLSYAYVSAMKPKPTTRKKKPSPKKK